MVPVLLSGGSGSRLWPLSREAYPKQFLALAGEHSLIQQAAARVRDPEKFEAPIIIANHEHRFLVAEHLRTTELRSPQIVLEPFGRNTAAAAATSALLVAERDPEALMLILPADHLITDGSAFLHAVDEGVPAAREGKIVLFGINPTNPATSYGYIHLGDRDTAGPLRQVSNFVEKPDRETAEHYVQTGEYVWNSGIFLLSAASLLRELELYAPEILEGCRQALAKATTDLDFRRLDAEAFASVPSVSLDTAVMERTNRSVVVLGTFPWTDVGSWSALWEVGDHDESGNVVVGNGLIHASRNCYIRSEDRIIAAVGIEDIIVVATSDAVLVASKSRDQDVKGIVERLKAEGHEAATQSKKVHRPWGFYQSLHEGERFQVKRITVNPGAKLSLQKHFHRAEHWVVVNGTALVTRDEEKILLRENESVFLPLGTVHRLENPGKVPLNLIEVQSGTYLGEDDIVRLEDVYSRA
jgi:mannose-1-phosphate guanylyltransferase/mannose-1-phosphate guanylyltransferase/mannose-6-phosphate isomerase